MNVTLRQLRYFVAAAECGKITEAASMLHITQSSVTEAIKALEAEAETMLVERHKRGISLTHDGYRFLHHAKRILADVTDLGEVLSSRHRNVEGELRLGVTYTVAGYFLATPLVRFAKAYPNVRFNVHEMERAAIERALLDGEAEIGILPVAHMEHGDRLDTQLILSAKRRLWVAANHPFSSLDVVSLDQVADQPYILLDRDEVELTVSQMMQRRVKQLRIFMRTTATESVRSLVAKGLGVAIHSDLLYRPWSLDGARIATVDLAEPIPRMDLGLVRVEHAEMSAAATAFCAFLRREYPEPFGASRHQHHGGPGEDGS